MTIEDLKSDFKWWESKRWIFNLLIIAFASYAIYNVFSQSSSYFLIDDILTLFIWLIGANVFYSLGILSQLFDWYYLNEYFGLKKYRLFLFVSGTLFSCVWTYFFFYINYVWTAW